MLAVRTLRKDTVIIPKLWAAGTKGELIYPIPDDQPLPDNEYFFLGILRGSGSMYKRCKKLNYNFYYADHAYFYNDNFPKTSCYRITKNHHVNTKLLNCKSDRYEKFSSIKIENWFANKGDNILVLPPDYYMCKFTNNFEWLEETINIIKRNTDRKIIIRERPVPKSFYDQLPIKPKKIDGVSYSNQGLDDDLKTAHCIVTFNSVVSIQALSLGIPVFTNSSFCPSFNFAENDFAKIESPFLPDNREELFFSLAYSQFTLDEIRSGFAYRTIQDYD